MNLLWKLLGAVVCLMSLLAASPSMGAQNNRPKDGIKDEILFLGERFYRTGILPSGKELKLSGQGGIPAESTEMPCAGCHLRAGFGTLDKGIYYPAITGQVLFKPALRPMAIADSALKSGVSDKSKSLFPRPAYTRESLEKALSIGVDPSGRTFSDIMPRYQLTYNDMSILITYLETLSTEYSPGVSDAGYKFATIITDDVNDTDRQALLVPLQQTIAARNQQADIFQNFKKVGFTPTVDMRQAFRRASLTVWELKGAPASWRRQLTEYYDKEPVFAVLGGISNSDWQPIHDFCEDRQLPCLFPLTDLPVISENSWYTYYFSKGYYQEGEAAARFINKLDDLPPGTKIVQIVQDSPAGLALASGFSETWLNLTMRPISTVSLDKKRLLNIEQLATVLKKQNPGILLLWADNDIVSSLPAVMAQLPSPGRVFVSSTYLGKLTASIPEQVRSRVYITFPFRLSPYVGSKLGPDLKVPMVTSINDVGDRRIGSRTRTGLQQVMFQSLNQLNDRLYRDYLLDILGMVMDLPTPDYEQISFGMGQRYVSRGCYIVQLGAGTNPSIIRKSEWIVQD